MPTLVCRSTGRRLVLDARCIVGRGSWVRLQLPEAIVSAEHASIYFDGLIWKVRDLGSRNGTFKNGSRLSPRGAHRLEAGDQLQFGGEDEPSWQLQSVLPPGPVARGTDGQLIVGDGATLWIPSSDDPEACVRFQGGHWVLEGTEETHVVQDEQEISLRSGTYALELPRGPGEITHTTESTLDASSTGFQLRFRPSQDKEHVALDAYWNGQLFPLGARAHNFALFVLAEGHLAERLDGIPEAECGWVYATEFRERLHLDREVFNLQIWRAIQQLKKARLPAECLIERRPDSQQLRIGCADLIIEAGASAAR